MLMRSRAVLLFWFSGFKYYLGRVNEMNETIVQMYLEITYTASLVQDPEFSYKYNT